MSEHPLLHAIYRASFTPLGWFAPEAGDKVPEPARFVIMIGNAGPAMFARFERERDVATDLIDEWTAERVTELATDLGATPIFPFQKPYVPFLTWARRGGGGHVSPLGLNIHSSYGLWHAYRAALLFPMALDLPPQALTPHPCEACEAKPCLSACPVQAFTPSGYDVEACAGHLRTDGQVTCMQRGCLARHACPIGRNFTYAPRQASFFMRAFLKARSNPQKESADG